MSTPARQAKALHQNIYSKTGNKSQDETLLQPFMHIAKHQNRGPLRLMTSVLNGWYDIPAEKMDRIQEIMRIVSNAGFLFDDIEDKSILRSGKPVSHSIYGVANTLAASNYSFMIAFEKALDFVEAETAEVDCGETIRKVTELIVEGFRGQGMKIYWREKFICPTEEEYCKMCKMKANGLFKLAVTLMSTCSTVNEDLSKLAEIIAFGFQIVNDYENLTSEVCPEKKAFCNDITEGRFSFPIIHAINSRPEDHRVMEILRLGTTDYKLKQHCLHLIEECGSLEYTKNKIAEIREKITQEMKKYRPNPQIDNLITFAFGNNE